MERKQILILTKSAKKHAYCVAGIDLDTNNWVRLVYEPDGKNGLTEDMLRYENGYECEVLDVINVVVIKRVPLEIQKENILINISYPFEFVRHANKSELLLYSSIPDYIYNGNEKRIFNRKEVISIGHSLIMVKVSNLVLLETGFHKKKISFEYRGLHYNEWSMTDPNFYYHPLGKIAENGYIVVSLPEDEDVHTGAYYKFVAKIFI